MNAWKISANGTVCSSRQQSTLVRVREWKTQTISREVSCMSGKYMAYVGSYSYTGKAKGITVFDVDVEMECLKSAARSKWTILLM